MASPKERLTELRERRPWVDHVVRMQEHFGQTNASQQAGAVTYFAFLSFFPVLALAFFVIGLLSHVYPGANGDLRSALDNVFPGLIASKKNPSGISLKDVRTFSGLAAVVGVLGVLYSGLGWVSALRNALSTVFSVPRLEQPSFVIGKLRDLRALVLVGVVLLLSVAVTSVVGGASSDVLGWIGLGGSLSWLVKLIGLVLGLAANALLFFTMFRLLAEPDVPDRSLWSGALLGAVGFEVLKQASTYLIKATTGQPAFQAFGIALILVVWINYFSRLLLYAAAWAYTTAEARALRDAEEHPPVQGPATPSLVDLVVVDDDGEQVAGPVPPSDRAWLKPFAAGGAAALALVAVVRRRDQ